MELKLIVIRTSNPKKLSQLYSILGLKFDYHKHGNSSLHYSASVGSTILEIYPLAKNQIEIDKYQRLGLSVDNFESIIATLKRLNYKFISEPTETDFGFLAVVLNYCMVDNKKFTRRKTNKKEAKMAKLAISVKRVFSAGMFTLGAIVTNWTANMTTA